MADPEFLVPDAEDPLTAPFFAACRRGELRVQRFAASGRMVWPPRPMDPHSQTLAHEWVELSGRGTVYSFVVPHPPLLPSYAALAPYNVILVALEEDPTLRMVGNLVAAPDGPINEIDPATIAIGEPVRVTFSSFDEVVLPQWLRA